MSELRDSLRAALLAAIKSRDRAAMAALRSALAAVDNAEAVDAASAAPAAGGRIAGALIGVGTGEVARRQLTEADVRAVVRTEVEDREAAADVYERSGKRDRAAALRAEARVLRAYLGPPAG